MTEELLARISLLEKENQRLKEEYIMLQNASEEYEDKLLKENQRLNNVLNKLEKWLEEERDYYFENHYYSDFNAYGSKLDDVLDKIHELKESDK